VTDRIFLRLGINGALRADSLQWILYRAMRQVPLDAPLSSRDWQGISFARSTKAILVRCIREHGIELSAEGRIALDRLADSFDAWKADPAQEGTPIAPETLKPSTVPETGSATYAEAEGGITMIERLGPNCAIGTDGRQWIVFRAAGRKYPRSNRAWQGDEWTAVGFIHSDKRALLTCIEAKGLKLSAQGRAAIDRQDAKMWRWYRAREVRAAAAE
jgi:hypothetical protein